MTINYSIPDNTHFLVKEDTKLDFSTPLFEKKTNKNISINIAKEIYIKPKNIFKYLKKFVGDFVKKDEIIAIKKSFFQTHKVNSPSDGIIKEIDHNQGKIILELEDKTKQQVHSPFKGQVVKISKNQIEIDLGKYQEFPLKKSLCDFGGPVFYFVDDNDFSSTNTENKILFIEKISSFIQTKAEALGIKGFITLQTLPQTTDVCFALLKNIDDVKKIIKSQFLYCTIISNSDKIYFYK